MCLRAIKRRISASKIFDQWLTAVAHTQKPVQPYIHTQTHTHIVNCWSPLIHKETELDVPLQRFLWQGPELKPQVHLAVKTWTWTHATETGYSRPMEALHPSPNCSWQSSAKKNQEGRIETAHADVPPLRPISTQISECDARFLYGRTEAL